MGFLQTTDVIIECGDISSFAADVIALKFARQFYGADESVALALEQAGIARQYLSPAIGDYRYVESRGCVAAGHVLFVGVPPLSSFGYREIRRFAITALDALRREAPRTESLAMTIHGPGYGLDEVEALMAEFSGCLEAMSTGRVPECLRHIFIVEKDQGRVERLRAALEGVSTRSESASKPGAQREYRLELPPDASVLNRPAEPLTYGLGPTDRRSEHKPHAFVAMSLSEDMDDVFYYGIQPPVHAAGLLCERVDQDSFTGDILKRIKERIGTATVVIAELTGANPNVYLEVGYAWGRKRPTILLVRDPQELRFDVRGQRCLTYKNIRHLEGCMAKEMKRLAPKLLGAR